VPPATPNNLREAIDLWSLFFFLQDFCQILLQNFLLIEINTHSVQNAGFDAESFGTIASS